MLCMIFFVFFFSINFWFYYLFPLLTYSFFVETKIRLIENQREDKLIQRDNFFAMGVTRSATKKSVDKILLSVEEVLLEVTFQKHSTNASQIFNHHNIELLGCLSFMLIFASRSHNHVHMDVRLNVIMYHFENCVYFFYPSTLLPILGLSIRWYHSLV